LLPPVAAKAVVVQVVHYAIPYNGVEPPDGVADVVPWHEKQVVPAKTYPDIQVKAETAPADEIEHVAIPALYPVIPVVAVVAAHGTQEVVEA